MVSEQEFNIYLGDQREEYDKIILANFMIQNPDLVRCNCGNIMYVEQGQIDMNQKDSNNKPISREAAECMSKYRVRCSQCQKNFCSNPGCLEEPYHEFKTCKQHKEHKEALKCRFCQSKLTQPSKS